MKEQLISLETAKLADKKYPNTDPCYTYSKYGLDEYELKKYNSRVYQGADPIYLAPTQSLLQKWLREKHDINVIVFLDSYSKNKFNVTVYIGYEDKGGFRGYDTYEDALEEGLKQALKRV
jgi:hypothetical protein